MPINYGLVLTGGGARAAYQAGALKGVMEVLGPLSRSKGRGGAESAESPGSNRKDSNLEPPGMLPFQVIAGISAGAINASFLAANASNSFEAIQQLCGLWDQLSIDQVLDTDVISLGRIGMGWMKDLSLGGAFGRGKSNHLLETSPLKAFIASKVNFKEIQNNIHAKVLRGLALSATNYRTGTAISFFDGEPRIEPWLRSSRIGLRSHLDIEHVLASAAIPILFAPVQIGHSFFGDGGIRMTSPLSPAIHLGADRILAIGIRYFRSDDYVLQINRTQTMEAVCLADIAGVMLNAAFLDCLESDIERLERINHTLALMPTEIRMSNLQKLRSIPILAIRPSQDLGTLASEQFHLFPRTLRYVLKGIGASDQQGWDLLSYLAFEKSYTGCLIELGYRDALAMKEKILEFFSE
jgi:NTE family protein